VATYYANNKLGRIEMLTVEQAYRLSSTVRNGGDAPRYTWYVNGVVKGNDSVLPATVQLHSFDTIVLHVASSFKCPSCPEVSDTVILDSLEAYERLELALSEKTHGCEGDSSYFSVQTVHAPAGARLTYRWYRNEVFMGETADSVRGFENVVSGESFRAEAYITNLNCVLNHAGNPAHTPIIKTTHKPILTLGAKLAVTPRDAICQYETVRINAAVTNGGQNPTVIWFLNDREVSREASYITDSLRNGDKVFARVMPSADVLCPNVDSVDSQPVTLTVSESPTVRIPQNDTIVDYGQEAFISGEVTSTRPYTFEWLPAYDLVSPKSQSTLVRPRSGRSYTFRAVNDLGCASNEASVYVDVRVCPSVSARTADVTVCAGDSSALSVYVVNYGNSGHSYVWQISTDFGATYTDIPASDGRFKNLGQTLSVRNVTANMDAATGMMFRCRVVPGREDCSEVYSGACKFHITPVPDMSVKINGNNEGCAGEKMTFTADVKGLSSSEPYSLDWYLNGSRLATQSARVTFNTLSDGDTLSVVLTHATNRCISQLKAGDSVKLNIHRVPALTVCG
ncbi:MAG: hypothetical protein K2H62_01225, partial [Bacteroidales bacterium]|nr:hypothetical protein [Bacteroidales bacterium]